MTAPNFRWCSPYPIELRPNPGVATVRKAITPLQSGRVHFEATDWPARWYCPNQQRSIQPDALVQVVGRQGLTLLVTPQPPLGCWIASP